MNSNQLAMADRSSFRPNLRIFGVRRIDPGWVYLIKNAGLLKVGKTKNPEHRIRNAKTWAPDLEIIGIKPFWDIGYIERALHIGLAQNWHAGEWFSFSEKLDYELITEGFREFYEKDRDMNSVDFIYWYNSSGLGEIAAEWESRGISLHKWKREASADYKQTAHQIAFEFRRRRSKSSHTKSKN